MRDPRRRCGIRHRDPQRRSFSPRCPDPSCRKSFDEVLHLLNGLIDGDNARDAEEGALQDRVGAVAESDFGGNLRGVDHIDRDILLCQHALDLVGHIARKRLIVPNGVEQEGTSGLNAAQHVVHVHVALHVAGHKVGGVHQIGGTNGVITETQVRASETTRLLRVVGEVSLAVLVGRFADDLDRVLVGTHRTVGAETVNLAWNMPSPPRLISSFLGSDVKVTSSTIPIVK